MKRQKIFIIAPVLVAILTLVTACNDTANGNGGGEQGNSKEYVIGCARNLCVAAAILDDIIGVVLLSLFISLDKGNGLDGIGIAIGKMIGFFAAAIAVGFVAHIILKHYLKRHPEHHRRIPIIGFAMAFFFAYAAEEWFGVADITGAYVAGIMLSTLTESGYIDRKVEVSNYMIFAPVFFASIGINADFGAISPAIVGFGFAFIAAGLIGKVLGCGIGSLICKYSFMDSLRVGIGMMARAEVVLVCTQKGVDSGLVDASIMPFVLILIIVSSLLTPLLLKLTYKHDKTNDTPLNPPLTDGGTEQSDVATEQSDSTQASDILSQADLPKTND